MDYCVKGDLLDAAWCGHLPELRRLLAESDWVEKLKEKDDYGKTALHKAAMNGHLECVTVLVEFGASVNTPDIAGMTPLHHAAANGHAAVAQYLVEKGRATPSKKSKKGYTPRQMAKANGRYELVRYFTKLENMIDDQYFIGGPKT